MLAWFYVCIAAVRRSLRFPALAFAVSIFWLLLAQWLTTSAACCCTAAASRLPLLRCMQRYELQSYDKMQASPLAPLPSVLQAASFPARRSRILLDAPRTRPGTRIPREDACATRTVKKIGGQSTNRHAHSVPGGQATAVSKRSARRRRRRDPSASQGCPREPVRTPALTDIGRQRHAHRPRAAPQLPATTPPLPRARP